MITALALTVALTTAKPMAGVREFNAPMCGANMFEREHTTQTEFEVIDSLGTCVSAEKYHPDFAVTSVAFDVPWQYPGIISGYTPEGESTCANPAKDTCYTYPVRVDKDGSPTASFGTWIAANYLGNESFDVWFSPVKARHSIKDKGGDTEVMIWTSYPGINDTRRFVAHATIDGMRFGIMSWIGGGPHRYVAYLWLGVNPTRKGHQVNMTGLALNPFFANAESHGWLNPSEWLWAIDFGFEMDHDGVGNNVHAYSLTQVK